MGRKRVENAHVTDNQAPLHHSLMIVDTGKADRPGATLITSTSLDTREVDYQVIAKVRLQLDPGDLYELHRTLGELVKKYPIPEED